VKTHFIEHFSFPFLSRACNGAACAAALRKRLAGDKPDGVVAYWAYPHGFAGLRLASELQIPCLVGLFGSDINSIPDWVTKRRVVETLRQASRIVSVSEDLRLRAISLGARPDAIRTIKNGCDPEIFHLRDRRQDRRALGIAEDAALVVFVGWLMRSKGVFELLQAMRTLVRTRPKAVLAMLGDGKDRKLLEKIARASGIGDRVLFLGAKKPCEVARWMGAANFITLPSHAEGSPNAVIEALHCGRPVVASSVGGIPELIDEHCGILTPANDSMSLACALEKALGCEWDEQGIAEARRRSWNDVARETLAFLQSPSPLGNS
jgi:glycosyltransferase involved in cell wall biosynthesis